MNKRKILMVTGSLHIGGMENVAMNIARYVDNSKFQVDFVVYGKEIGEYEKEVKVLGGEVYHIPFPREGARKYCFALRKILDTAGPYDVVHSHNLFPSGMVMKVAYDENVPVRIAHAHTNRDDTHLNVLRKIYQTIMRELIWRYSTQMFACSQKAGHYLFGDKFDNNGYVMNNGVATEQFVANLAVQNALKKEFGITSECVIGHTGRFVDVKNHRFLIDVFKSVCDKGENVKLLLVGDGPLKREIEEKVCDLGLSGKVIFTGMRTDVPQILSLMDVYVLPSKYEGVSVSLMEAQAAGVPFVVSESAFSDESKVTQYGVSVNLSDSIESWRDAVIQEMHRGKLKNARQIIIDKGYDSGTVIKYVQETYYTIKENRV